MIIVRIKGGLGNQMFQYSIGKSIATLKNDTLKLDISFYSSQKLRTYALNQFCIDENIASQYEVDKLAGKSESWVKRKLGFKSKRPISYFEEKDICVYDRKVFEYEGDIYLDGYWQCDKYFKNIEEKIKSVFILKNDISKSAKEHLKNIQATNSVSVHIRRGDYVDNQKVCRSHGVAPATYYKDAVYTMIRNKGECSFFIFSDDIEWCKDKFDFIERKFFIDDTQSEYDDLELMRSCKHNIIANSTFSWWAAWLNKNNHKQVIAPKVWFLKPEWRDKNIACDNWIKI